MKKEEEWKRGWMEEGMDGRGDQGKGGRGGGWKGGRGDGWVYRQPIIQQIIQSSSLPIF